MKLLPIGVSAFANIIRTETLYVDKTKVIYDLIHGKNPKRYFFSRPRRFGKSLTCSTLYSIFMGHKELFKDLWIGSSDYEWKRYPIIFFDFSGISHGTHEELINGLHSALNSHAMQYNISLKEQQLTEKFAELITTIKQNHGYVVIIIDEYDKPLVDILDDINEAELSQKVLRKFYSTLKEKNIDESVDFLFITGVSKFSKIALFSDLNNLYDLTNDERAAALVGYTDQEIDHYLSEHIQQLADAYDEEYNHIRQQLKSWYNGYQFGNKGPKIYNPFSLHNCLTKKFIDNYWFTSGTPNFLMKFIKQNPLIASDIETIDGSFIAASELESLSLEFYYENYRTLLLQTGYLTFAGNYNPHKRGYSITYPNEEVRYSMTEQIMKFVGNVTPEQFGEFGARFRTALADDNLPLFCKHMENFIKLVPHNIRVDREKFYQQIFFMVCVLFGKRPATEVATEEGFMDLLLEGTTYTFVIEFKRNSTPEIALEQIKEKRYWESYAILETKKIILAGITFNRTDEGIQVLYITEEI